MKKIFAIAFFVMTLSLSTVYAQDDDKLVSGSISFSPHYLWRGLNYTSGIVATSEVGIDVGGFSFSAEGIINAIDPYGYKEINLYAGYTWNGLNITLADFFSSENPLKYFEYDNSKTNHILEASLTYEFQNIPIWASVATSLWGADKDDDTWTKQLYSTYLEVGGYYDFNETSSLTLTLGAGMPNSVYSYYANKVTICNVDLTYQKVVELNDAVSMPLTVSVVSNPAQKLLFANFGIGIAF